MATQIPVIYPTNISFMVRLLDISRLIEEIKIKRLQHASEIFPHLLAAKTRS